MRIKEIITGWSKAMGLMKISQSEQDLSTSRLIICSNCEHAKPNKCLEFINGDAIEIEGMYCTVCYCPCLQKSLSNEICPLGKWNNLKAL
jgi:hypothetical protein